MDSRGRLLVDMILSKDQRTEVNNRENSVTNTEKTEIKHVNNNNCATSPVSSPCREIPESNPVMMEQLMHELAKPEDDSIKQYTVSCLTKEPSFQNSITTETSWSLPNSVLTDYVDQPTDDVPSHISSFPSSLASGNIQLDAVSSSPGDMLLLVGSVSSQQREKDFSPASDSDPNYSPTNDNLSFDSSGDERPPLSDDLSLKKCLDEVTELVHEPNMSSHSSDSETASPNIDLSPKIYLDEVTGLLHKPTVNEVTEAHYSQGNQINQTRESQIETNTTGRPRKGRKRKHSNLTRALNKINRNSNKIYFDYKDNEKGPRVFNNIPCLCSNKCNEKISSDIRCSEFNRFWALASYDAQNAYIASKITQKPTQNKSNRSLTSTMSNDNTVLKSKQKKFTRCYRLQGDIKVCKMYFLKTYQISSCRVNTALKKVNSDGPLKCQRGLKQGGKNKTADDKRKEVIEFIRRIPTYESHYCRSQTNARFLPPDMTLSKIIDMYKEEYKDNNRVSDAVFKNIFYSEFNLRTATLKKDTCNFWDKIKAQMVNENNISKKEELKKIHAEHLTKAEEAQQLLQADLKYARENADTECITYDMEKTLPLPRIPTNVVFYKRQLWLYNEGVYSGKKDQGYCYIWVEGEAGKGAQEVGSVLRKHVKEENIADVKNLIFWSDSCGGQNRNIKITLLLKTLLEELPNLERITMKFLYSGHSFLPNDRHFANIECALRLQQRLYTPEDYINVIKNSKKKKPLIVKRMEKTDFVGTEKIEKHVINRKTSVNKEKISWLNAREIKFNKAEKYLFHVKESFAEDVGMTVDIKSRNKSQECFYDLLTPLWPNGKAISLPKLKDLTSLLALIPKDCQDFYLNLHSGPDNIIDDVDGFNVTELDFEQDRE